jgi:hypothetical protein
MGLGRAVKAPRAMRLTTAAGVTALLAIIPGCGSEDFANDPRPPVPAEITARIDAKSVQVSPDKIGGGLATFTVANLSRSPEQFQITGPTEGTTAEIQPGANAYLKMELKKGTYRASAPGSGIQGQSLQVDQNRESSQNDLLLP